MTRAEFERALADAGLIDVEIRETHPRARARLLGDRPGAQAADLTSLADPVVITGAGQSGLTAARGVRDAGLGYEPFSPASPLGEHLRLDALRPQSLKELTR